MKNFVYYVGKLMGLSLCLATSIQAGYQRSPYTTAPYPAPTGATTAATYMPRTMSTTTTTQGTSQRLRQAGFAQAPAQQAARAGLVRQIIAADTKVAETPATPDVTLERACMPTYASGWGFYADLVQMGPPARPLATVSQEYATHLKNAASTMRDFFDQLNRQNSALVVPTDLTAFKGSYSKKLEIFGSACGGLGLLNYVQKSANEYVTTLQGFLGQTGLYNSASKPAIEANLADISTTIQQLQSLADQYKTFLAAANVAPCSADTVVTPIYISSRVLFADLVQMGAQAKPLATVSKDFADYLTAAEKTLQTLYDQTVATNNSIASATDLPAAQQMLASKAGVYGNVQASAMLISFLRSSMQMYITILDTFSRNPGICNPANKPAVDAQIQQLRSILQRFDGLPMRWSTLRNTIATFK